MASANDVIRLSLRYSVTGATILGADPIAAPAPHSDFSPKPTSTGAWLTVLTPRGKNVFHRPLPDPFIGGEVLAKNGAMRRLKRRRALFATVELPWPGPGSMLEVHVRETVPRRTKGRRVVPKPSLIARLPLEPKRMRRPQAIGLALEAATLAAPLFPVTIDQRWGHDNPKALVLAFMPDGFLAADMPRFQAQVDTVIQLFEQIEPYKSLLKAMKVARIAIPSEANTIGDTAGPTYFKGHFSTGGIARVIEVDQLIAARTISDHFPGQSARALIIVNTETYGGSGGAAVAFSCVPYWSAHIAIHELGHSHFGLADEYSEAGQSATKNPIEPNVSADYRRKKLKWAALVAADTPLPTWRAKDGEPNAADARIGAFEGGKYQVNGVWRPSADCKMRHLQTAAFCAVCRGTIGNELRRFL